MLVEVTAENSRTVTTGVLDNFRAKERQIREQIKTYYKLLKCRGNSSDTNVESTDFLRSIIDVHNTGDSRIRELQKKKAMSESSYTESKIATVVSPEAGVCVFEDAPSGFFIIRNALTDAGQILVAKLAVEQYSRSPYTNLTNLESIQKGVRGTSYVEKSFLNLWDESSHGRDTKFCDFKKLRWASIGYHYDWSSRMYHQNEKSHFPSELRYLCQVFASLVGEEISPEAAIVNYYPLTAQMCGHLDDAELCMDEPIVSISLGRSAIFLLGGRSKEVEPVPFILRSGDVVVMSGESRFCYHGVPAIIPLDTSFDSENTASSAFKSRTFHYDSFPSDEDAIRRYLDQARININVRRVTRKDGIWAAKNGSDYNRLQNDT